MNFSFLFQRRDLRGDGLGQCEQAAAASATACGLTYQIRAVQNRIKILRPDRPVITSNERGGPRVAGMAEPAITPAQTAIATASTSPAEPVVADA
jgi:hypothetical protein